MAGHWEQIRQQARIRHAQALAAAGGQPSATALLEAAARLTGVGREAVSGNNPLLDGGLAQLDPEAETIWYNGDLDPRLAVAYQAHEYGHHWLGDESAV
jgi:DNA helicase-2/ATP-dependent DNA helicase PcrA